MTESDVPISVSSDTFQIWNCWPETQGQVGANPETEYLECQRRDCIYNDIEGVRQRNVLLLEEVFVSLQLTQSSYGVGPMGACYGDDQSEDRLLGRTNLQIWDLLGQVQQKPSYSRLVILAQGGYGKTTLLRHVAYTYATGRNEQLGVPKFIPILLHLRKWRDILAQDNAVDLPTLITQYHIPELPGGKSVFMPNNWAGNLLQEGKALVLVDGFDEVTEAQRESVSQWLNQQMRDYPKSLFFLTSRPGGYEYYLGQDNFKSTVFVQPFEPEQWKNFIHKWYVCHERARRVKSEENLITVQDIATKVANQLITQIEAPEQNELALMATNPLLLNMIAALHENNPGGNLPRYRTELYEAICHLQLGDRPEAKKMKLLLSAKKSQRVLQWLALKMQEETITQVPKQVLLNFLTESLNGLDEQVTVETYLKWLCQVSELLVERNTNEYEFSHRSFQSYLAAVEVGQRNKESWLLDQWDHEQDWWHETIILYIAQLNNPNAALQSLVNQGAVDLAYKCLKETSNRITPELETALQSTANQLQDLRFQALERYMKENKWVKADEETYRLMITTVGKNEGEWLTEKELITFPRKELLKIDKLWRKYSNGKFGFSVQREIYLKCGAELNGKHPGQDIWKKFGDYVGWRKEDRWLSYKNYACNPVDSPYGHLPTYMTQRKLDSRSNIFFCQQLFSSLLSHPDLDIKNPQGSLQKSTQNLCRQYLNSYLPQGEWEKTYKALYSQYGRCQDGALFNARQIDNNVDSSCSHYPLLVDTRQHFYCQDFKNSQRIETSHKVITLETASQALNPKVIYEKLTFILYMLCFNKIAKEVMSFIFHLLVIISREGKKENSGKKNLCSKE